MKTLIASLALAASSLLQAGPVNQAHGLAIDPNGITVSGISSGAAMAQQLHLAYPDLFSGAALIAGVPWGCAEGSIATALGQCTARAEAPLPVAGYLERLRSAAADGRVGDPQLLADDRAWVFHGSLDKAVAEPVSRAAFEVYAGLLPAAQLAWVADVAAAHNFPTLAKGHACDAMQPPFIGACDYDAAGELLGFLYPGLDAPDRATTAELQAVTLPGAAAAGLDETAFLYLPESCPENGCRLHLVLHGCKQSQTDVGQAFMQDSGYLPWAIANQVVLAFPQVVAGAANPLSCWDWWGYTGVNYLERDAAQMRVLADWVRSLGE
jgi:pimeloyl-ACP methyl ester carboxylesterase